MSSFLLAKMRPTEDAVTGLLVDLLRAWPEPNVVATSDLISGSNLAACLAPQASVSVV